MMSPLGHQRLCWSVLRNTPGISQLLNLPLHTNNRGKSAVYTRGQDASFGWNLLSGGILLSSRTSGVPPIAASS